MMVNAKILIIDDDQSLLDSLEEILSREGFACSAQSDGRDVLKRVAEESPDLVILDLVLPDADGLEICRDLRARTTVPVLILSARDEETDKVLGLGMGADDYLAKPFGSRELVARVKAVLRRYRSGLDLVTAETSGQNGVVRAGVLEIDPKRHLVRLRGKAVDLTPKEFALLQFLAKHPGQVFSHQAIFEMVWEGGPIGEVGAVSVYIKRLRDKIEEDPSDPKWLKTVRGVGYKFEA